MKKRTVALAALASAAAVAGTGYLVFEEVMSRDAFVYQKIADMVFNAQDKKAEETGTVKINRDERPETIWFNEQELIEYEMINPKNFRLRAFCLPAEKESDVYVFCSHGYRSTGKGEYGVMAKFYHDLGYNVFIIDHQAHGESDGKYIGFGYHESQDAMLWLNWMIEKFGKDIKIILQGISMGCATVMMMTGNPELPENVKFTVADCGYTSAKAEFEYILKNFAHLPGFPIINTSNFFNKYINGFAFEDANPLESVANAKIPMLFIHGNNDDFVPTYMVHELYAACSSEYKDMLLVDGAAHAESYCTNTPAYEAKVKEFAEKFI